MTNVERDRIQEEARRMAVRYSFDDEESGTVQYEGALGHVHGSRAGFFSIKADRV